MPALAAPFIGFALGGSFAWLGREELARRSTSFESRGFLVVMFYALLVYAPICCYVLSFATDWSLGYFVDPGRHTLLVLLLLVILASISPIVGFSAVALPATRQRFATVVRLIAGAVLIALAVLVPGAERLGVDATFSQFHDDFGKQRLIGSSLGYGILWMGGVLGIASAWAGRTLRRLGSERA